MGPDFEVPVDENGDNDYDVTVRVADANGNSATAPVTVTVTDEVESRSLYVSRAYSEKIPESRSYTASPYLWPEVVCPSECKVDEPAVGAVAWTKTGADEALFTLDAQTGDLSLPQQDLENPEDANTDNNYEVTLQATDADGNGATKDVSVRVIKGPPAWLTISGLSVLQVTGTIHDDDDGPPMASFDLDGAECDADLCRAVTGGPVRLTDTSTGKVVSRWWEFGDRKNSLSRGVEQVWSSPGFYEVTLSVSDGTTVSTARRVFLIEAAVPLGTCVADPETLCLQDSRYEAAVEWRKPDGERGVASVVYAGTNDSGLFYFFSRENWEILVKVLDSCALNGHVWVYGASTTDLGYTIRVTDTVTGKVKEYGNEPGLAAPAITDATAFAESCDRR